MPTIQFKNNPLFHFVKINTEKQMLPCKSTAKEVSFEWSHHRILLTDLKVRTMLHVSIVDSGREWVKNIPVDSGSADSVI